MITTRGQIIEIDGTTEWLLFNRLSKKIHPVDFLSQTDSFIQFPNFLFTFSFFTFLLADIGLWYQFSIPAMLYFTAFAIVNFRAGAGFLKLMKLPMLFFPKLNFLIMGGVFISSFFYISWWTLLAIPVYFLSMAISIFILTSQENKLKTGNENNGMGNYQIFKNNAFLLMYKYYARDWKLPKEITPSPEETENKDWLKPYTVMRSNWDKIETHFNRKAKVYWRVYLNLDK
jgi:hypothetical protein